MIPEIFLYAVILTVSGFAGPWSELESSLKVGYVSGPEPPSLRCISSIFHSGSKMWKEVSQHHITAGFVIK